MRKSIRALIICLAAYICISPAYAEYSTFSIIGDSWSTFVGYTYPESNVSWYPTWQYGCEGYESGNDVLSAKETWWYRITECGIRLVENRSYSGSPIGYDGYGECNNDAKDISFVTRINGIQDVDLIIIQGGLNDSAVDAMPGEYKYSDLTESDFIYFRPSLAYVLDYLTTNTHAEIVFMKCEGLQGYISDSIDEVCKHYGVSVLCLHDISTTKWHPNSMGMQSIFEQTMDFLANRLGEYY